MVTLAELLELERESNVEIAYCDYIADYDNEKENIRTRILYDDQSGKYYYHQMQNGNVMKCFEIALSWKPFGDDRCYIFNYTPDNFHIYEVDSRQPEKVEILKLKSEQIQPGAECSYCGLTVKYESENSISFNGKSIEIVPDSSYVFKLLKTKIRAMDGAKELYRFLENIATNGNIGNYGEDDVNIGEFTLMSHEKSWWIKFLMKYGR